MRCDIIWPSARRLTLRTSERASSAALRTCETFASSKLASTPAHACAITRAVHKVLLRLLQGFMAVARDKAPEARTVCEIGLLSGMHMQCVRAMRQGTIYHRPRCATLRQ
jgi:hypothetical protein